MLVLLLGCPGSRGGAGGGGGGGAGGGGAGGTDDNATFSVFYPDQPADGFKAKVGKRFGVKPAAQCVYENGRDGRWTMTGARVESGELPPGLAIEDGAIGGTAREAGTWTFKVKFAGVTCAGKAQEPVLVDVKIVVAS